MYKQYMIHFIIGHPSTATSRKELLEFHPLPKKLWVLSGVTVQYFFWEAAISASA